ncbi:MAG: 50S ribosomal protein L9 [Acholeplasmatales bacterium]|nr:50S ribosomal protein L9 [Acholeplasmatales bacterium]
MKKILIMFIIVVGIVLMCVLYPLAWSSYDKDETIQIIVYLASFAVAFGTITGLILSYVSNAQRKKIKWLETKLEVWNNTSYHVKKAGDVAFNELPVGIVLCDEQLEIKWANQYAKQIFQSKLMERPLQSIHNELYNQVKENQEHIMVSIYDKTYDVMFRKEDLLLYFFDVTEREKIKNRYKDRTTALGIIYLDNMEQSLAELDVQQRSELRGKYLGEISDWITNAGGYLKSYSDDRLIIVLDYSQLQTMIKSRFDILNRIREISEENELRVTASMGIACWDVKYEELGTYAQNAIELAEKRGGDQVVVNIQDEKIQYFGAKTNALEKSSKVLVRVMAQTLVEHIEKAGNVLIMGHTNTDTDSYGGTLTLLKICLSIRSDVRVVIDRPKCDKTVQKLLDLTAKEHIGITKYFVTPKEALDLMDDDTLLIVVDTQSPKIVMNPAVLEKAKNLAVIDHHRRGEVTYENPIFNYVEPYASSSTELIVEMIPFVNKKVEISAFEATMMLAGIIVDTNNFTFRTGSRTFDVASQLKEYGADMIKAKTFLREDIERRKEIAEIETRAEILFKKYAVVKIAEAQTMDRVLLAQVADRLLEIDGVQASFAIGQLEEKLVGISARSYEGVNVQIIMEELGGGGHLNGAAAQLQNVSIEDAYKMLYDILEKEELQEGEENMKIILKEEVKGKGKKDDVVEVADGYGNFLISQGKAIQATADNLKKLKEDKEKEAEEAAHQLQILNKLKDEINNKSINVYIKIGDDGKLFGSITTKQIAEEFEKAYGIHIDKRKIEIQNDINSLGIYEAEVKLQKDIEAKIEVHVLEKKD